MKKAELLMNLRFLPEDVLAHSACSVAFGCSGFCVLGWVGSRDEIRDLELSASVWIPSASGSPEDFGDLHGERFWMPVALVGSHRFHRFDTDWMPVAFFSPADLRRERVGCR